jgi:hypothetical protein
VWSVEWRSQPQRLSHRPSENGASVLMISGGGGNRRSALFHAEMLVGHGYGVLVYDPRRSGNSAGTVNSYRTQGGAGRADRPQPRAAPDHLRREGGEGVGRALYDRAGGARSELWYLPKASHTAALRQYPESYEQRVVSFFDENLRAT